MAKQPNINSASEKELANVESQFESFKENIDSLTLDRMNQAPKQEVEPQTKLTGREIDKKADVYLKPHTTISCQDKFNEKFRDEYNFQKEYVQFIAENKEIIGETIELWTRPFSGMPAEFWKVPVNKPVWGPRYLAEQIKRCYYHRLVMQQGASAGSDHAGQYYGSMVADTTLQRLDALPVSSKRSVFMGASSF